MSSDFNFERYYATVRAQGFAGITGPEDFLFRYVRGIGMGSRAMPLFELFQLGGNGSVRGIEQGELVGRGMAIDQSEIGVNTASLWRWVSRKQDPPKAAPPASSAVGAGATAPALSKLGISSIFLVGFYDRGRVTQAASLGELLDLQHALHGYGCKVELRGLRAGTRVGNLSMGYARSPGSVLHSKGVFITAFSLEF
jgi:outer membrane protein assembly factor BamA